MKCFQESHVRNLLSLTATCQQIHNEAIPIFYSFNTFDMEQQKEWGGIRSGGRSAQCLRAFRTGIGAANTLFLRSVKIYHASEYHEWNTKIKRRGIRARYQEVVGEGVYHQDCVIRVMGLRSSRFYFNVNLGELEGEWDSLLRRLMARSPFIGACPLFIGPLEDS